VAHILVVDDEEPLRLSLGYSLSKEGYSVSTAVDGPSALAAASSLRPDAILLDVMLPGLDGMEVCRRIRAGSDVPIILLTARDAASDAILGLESGADDYVTKPFSTGILLARLRSVIRRRASAQRLLDEDRALLTQLDELVRRGEDLLPPVRAGSGAATARVVVDPATRRASVDGTPLELSASECTLLAVLVAGARRVVTRTELVEQVWGTGQREGFVLLDGIMRSLGSKIDHDVTRPRLLVQVPGIGWQLDDEPVGDDG